MEREEKLSNSETEGRCAAILEAIHYVIKGERLLKRASLPIDLIPVPREISSDCGMAIQFPCEQRGPVERLLVEADITLVGIYALRKGRYEKV